MWGPIRKVIKAEYSDNSKKRGGGRTATLTLECGHVVQRAASDVRKSAKCWQCAKSEGLKIE